MAEWLAAGAEIPDDPDLAAELVGPQHGYSSKSTIQLASKQDMKARGLASPDRGDALNMTFAVNVLAKPREIEEPPRLREWCWGLDDPRLSLRPDVYGPRRALISNSRMNPSRTRLFNPFRKRHVRSGASSREARCATLPDTF